MNLYILSYNNYYNRIVKKENNITDYLSYVTYGPLVGANFNPNDGVNTEATFGGAGTMYNGKGDYLLAVNDNNQIVSRWFIIDHERLCNGQWRTALRRDLLADFYDEVINGDVFIEKANLSYDDPLIFNEEAITVNQIKQSELLLKDKSQCPWLVGYYIKSTDQVLTANLPNDEGFSYIVSDDITKESWYKYTTNAFLYPTKINLDINMVYSKTLDRTYIQYTFNNHSLVFNKYSNHTMPLGRLETENLNAAKDQILSAINSDLTTFEANLALQYGFPNADAIQDIEELNGKIFFDRETQLYYKISLETVNQTSSTFDYVGAGIFQTYLTNLCLNTNAVFDRGSSVNDNNFRINRAQSTGYKILLESFSVNALSATISETESLKTKNSPYNIFAIPYGTITITNGEESFQTDKDISIRIMSELIKNYSGANPVLLDAQLLPYCPYQDILGNQSIDITNLDSVSYSFITSGSEATKVGIILNCPTARFDFIYNYEIAIDNPKISNECDLYRLCSPNWNGAFDFSPAKNGGVNYFNIECEYKPYNPYIHIAPNFKNLYGNRIGDAVGLICGGDFGLSMTSDAWATYERQNKNFQNIFDRQIQNMEVQNKYTRILEKVQVATGTVQGAAAGALTGSMMGGGAIGGVIGGVVGGAASLGGGIADMTINEKLRNEAMDYTKDMFGYQLGNIQALPQTLSKVSSFNNNNKIFPFLEYYTCTEREKNAFAQKIAWNGMTVMAIGKINDYMSNSWSYNDITSKNYIKGQLIRLDSIDDDFHIINSISGELNKGAYFE